MRPSQGVVNARARLFSGFALGLAVGFALALMLVGPSWKRDHEAAREWRKQYYPVPWSMTCPNTEPDVLDNLGVALDSLNTASRRRIAT